MSHSRRGRVRGGRRVRRRPRRLSLLRSRKTRLIELIAKSRHMMVVVSRATYDLDAMMEALVRGKGEWVYEQTRHLAEAGLLKAQLMMGILCQLGIGVAQ